ncbi:hypothetical protein HDV01_003015 [Terramyces sp. JEL0728]|nr:hypothetical protein HDV01_003015 [Terramyces sp. JEL0728]
MIHPLRGQKPTKPTNPTPVDDVSDDEEQVEQLEQLEAGVQFIDPQAQTLSPVAQQAIAAKDARLQCRMYENKLPEQDTCVMVNVRQITDVGTYVHLLEYNNIEGMILLSELTRRRIRSIQKLVRIGKNEVAVVMRVDKEKGTLIFILGYIDLSKRRATAEDIAQCEERYSKSKAVHSIMRHVADKLNMELEELYTLYGWPLYKKYGHAYDAFKTALVDDGKIFEEMRMPEHIQKELVSNIKRRLTPQPIKIRADIECSCFGYEGIDAVKAALKAGEDCSTSEIPIKIRLVAPPQYVMISNCVDKNLGIEVMNQAIAKIEEVVKSFTGSVTVKMMPRAVSENDDADLQKLMEEKELENKEVSGDEDDDEDLE